MWMPPTHPQQSLHTHTQMHFQSLDHSQTGVEDSNTLISGYESFNQSSSQLGQYGAIFEPIHMVDHSASANHIAHADVDEVNVGETRINRMNETIVEEREEAQEAQNLEEDDDQPWRQDTDARNSKSSQLPSRAHSRSPALSSNLADTQEARRAEAGAWRCPPEIPLASPPSSFPPTALKSTALSVNPHNNQHRSVGQYKGLSSQAKRRLKSSISLDSLRSSHPFSQNSHYSLPLRLSSSTTTTSAPAPSDNISPTASTPTTRDQVASPNPSTRSSGIDKKVFQSRLRRRPSAQAISSANVLDRLKLEDTMMAHSPQHIQPLPHERITGMEELSSTEQMLDKYRMDGSFGAPLPLSPPPSATRPEFMGAGLASNTFHMAEEAGLSFNGSELSLIKPHSMSALRDVSSFHETGPGEGDISQMGDQYQDMNQVGESSLFIRRSPPENWASSNWLAEIPQSLEMSIMESPPGQSPTTQHWVEHDDTEAANLRLSATNGLPMMMQGINHSQTTFRLASPPTGRGIHRMPSCPSFRGSSLGYQIQQPPSPALEDHEETNYSGYMERSGSNSSSIPSPPDSPDFYFPTSQLNASTLGFSVTPLMSQDGFGSDIYTQMPEPQHTGMHQSSIASTPRSSRTSSRSIPSVAAAAAAAALAATKNSSKTSKSRSARRVVSNSNGRSSSSRNGSASSSSGSVSGGRGLGLGSEGGEMPFVNFTPQDATKILSGVAPSGSSKTKARREKEALEKRRKLSEAAAAVVRAAGGDVSQLSEELLAIN